MLTVRIDDLRDGMELARDLFLDEDDMIPFLKKNTKLNSELIEKLRERGFLAIHINNNAEPLPIDVSRMFDIPREKPVISTKLQGEALSNLKEAFEAFSGDVHESSKVIVQMDEVVSDLIGALRASENSIVSINDLKSFDEYTYHHSLSVAVLSLAIAEYLNFNPEQMQNIGMCALMHDIGKIAVPIQIINKPSKLSDEEYAMIKSHSSAGFDVLAKSGLVGDDILQGVLHHHERVDGFGYPDGLCGDDIHIYSKIISIADVYDALTSNRPYRVPMQPAEAIEYIMGEADHAFDFDLVNAFIQKLELYPVGGVVELSNGVYAAVVKNENQLRPIVKTQTGEVLDLAKDSLCRNIVIKRLVR